jgi:Ca2+-dependent lipid-binding protein
MNIILFGFLMILGVLTHFAKKKVKGETLADFKTYFMTHFKSSIITFVGAGVSFAILYQTGELSVASAFFAGYSVDSLFNRNLADIRKGETQ